MIILLLWLDTFQFSDHERHPSVYSSPNVRRSFPKIPVPPSRRGEALALAAWGLSWEADLRAGRALPADQGQRRA